MGLSSFVSAGHERQGDTGIVITVHAYAESEITTMRNGARKTVNTNELQLDRVTQLLFHCLYVIRIMFNYLHSKYAVFPRCVRKIKKSDY
jgi:hypothetical protein